jgi:3-oxoacyl-[acyl-carrier-protein] synthase II
MSEANITGLGIVSPIGVGKQAFLEGLLEGRCGLVRLSVLNAEEFRVGRGGEVAAAGFR